MLGAKLAEFKTVGLCGPSGSAVSVKVAVGGFLVLLKIAETVKVPAMGPDDVTIVDAWPLTSAVTVVALRDWTPLAEKKTGANEAGFPDESWTWTTRGALRGVLTTTLWLLPDTTLILAAGI
jgi:hypothetical protein